MKTFQIAICTTLLAVASFAAIHQAKHSSQSGPIVVSDGPLPIRPLLDGPLPIPPKQ